MLAFKCLNHIPGYPVLFQAFPISPIWLEALISHDWFDFLHGITGNSAHEGRDPSPEYILQVILSYLFLWEIKASLKRGGARSVRTSDDKQLESTSNLTQQAIA